MSEDSKRFVLWVVKTHATRRDRVSSWGTHKHRLTLLLLSVQPLGTTFKCSDCNCTYLADFIELNLFFLEENVFWLTALRNVQLSSAAFALQRRHLPDSCNPSKTLCEWNLLRFWVIFFYRVNLFLFWVIIVFKSTYERKSFVFKFTVKMEHLFYRVLYLFWA